MAETRLDTDITKPSVTQPGDGPHDTTDPLERASTVVPRPGAAALATGTVNSALPIPTPAKERGRRSQDRTEEYQATRPDGSTVTVQRNIETGESRVKESTDTGSHRTAGN